MISTFQIYVNHFKLTIFFFTKHNVNLSTLIIITDLIPCYINVYIPVVKNKWQQPSSLFEMILSSTIINQILSTCTLITTFHFSSHWRIGTLRRFDIKFLKDQLFILHQFKIDNELNLFTRWLFLILRSWNPFYECN